MFIKCKLDKVNFREANLEKVIFDHCSLSKADLSGAKIEGISFEGSTIETTYLNLEGFLSFGISKGFVLKE